MRANDDIARFVIDVFAWDERVPEGKIHVQVEHRVVKLPGALGVDRAWHL